METGSHPLQPVIAGWIGKIECARRHKKPWQEIADECMEFFAGTTDFMWKANYRFKFWDAERQADICPRFRMTLNKAFELVALFGPALYHRNPIRTVAPRQPMQFNPAILGPMAQDPMMGMAIQQLQLQEQVQAQEDQTRAELLSRYLNYTPNELPFGGLAAHAQAAITEALIKGRGCLWTDIYQPPGARHRIVGSFYDTVDNLFIDPDAETLAEAKWIARRCVHPYWQVEREYGLPADSLKEAAKFESGSTQGETKGDDLANAHRAMGQTNDLIVYYKIWSRMGIGARMTGVKTELKQALEMMGDYCYLVVAQDVPYPLNVPTEALLTRGDSELVSMVQWPVPYWTDDRWPVNVLDFYRKPRSSWPIAPLQPGMGELKFLNVMISHLANRIWTSCRDFIAILKSASDTLRDQIENGKDQCIIELEGMHTDIRQVVQFLQQPQTNMDVWKILEAVSESFDRRVGLTELVYGISRRQMRSAQEAAAKQEQISIRPDHMAHQVEQWMTEAARLEGMTARWHVTAEDVAMFLGPTAGLMWQTLVMQRDVEKVVREMEYRIEAGSARKPNKDRDVANVSDALPMFMPVLDGHAAATGDTGPINSLIDQWGRAADFDTSKMRMGPRIPLAALMVPQGQEGQPDGPPAEGEQTA